MFRKALLLTLVSAMLAACGVALPGNPLARPTATPAAATEASANWCRNIQYGETITFDAPEGNSQKTMADGTVLKVDCRLQDGMQSTVVTEMQPVQPTNSPAAINTPENAPSPNGKECPAYYNSNFYGNIPDGKDLTVSTADGSMKMTCHNGTMSFDFTPNSTTTGSCGQARDLGPWAPNSDGKGETFEVTSNELVSSGVHVQLWWPGGSDQKWGTKEISVFIPAGLSITVLNGGGKGWEYALSCSLNEIESQMSADNARRQTDTSYFGRVGIDDLIKTGLVEVRFDRRAP